MSGHDAPVCPKSGLLRSRCRCKDPACWGRPNSSMRHRTSRHQRKRMARRAKVKKAAEAGTQAWLESVWKAHAKAHPEMWSEGYGRDN